MADKDMPDIEDLNALQEAQNKALAEKDVYAETGTSGKYNERLNGLSSGSLGHLDANSIPPSINQQQKEKKKEKQRIADIIALLGVDKKTAEFIALAEEHADAVEDLTDLTQDIVDECGGITAKMRDDLKEQTKQISNIVESLKAKGNPAFASVIARYEQQMNVIDGLLKAKEILQIENPDLYAEYERLLSEAKATGKAVTGHEIYKELIKDFGDKAETVAKVAQTHDAASVINAQKDNIQRTHDIVKQAEKAEANGEDASGFWSELSEKEGISAKFEYAAKYARDIFDKGLDTVEDVAETGFELHERVYQTGKGFVKSALSSPIVPDGVYNAAKSVDDFFEDKISSLKDYLFGDDEPETPKTQKELLKDNSNDMTFRPESNKTNNENILQNNKEEPVISN